MDRLTKRRLAAYYRELKWLRPILRPHERWLDEVSRKNLTQDDFVSKLGSVKMGETQGYVSVILVDARGSKVRAANLTPRRQLNPLTWFLKLFRLVDPLESWTLYGALKRLQSGEIENPVSVVLERANWILILNEYELPYQWWFFTKCTVSVTMLKVRSNEKLSELMALYDQSRWEETQFVETERKRNVS